MIDQYDAVEEQVKLHEAFLKGKAKADGHVALGMRVIIEKNRKINLERKQLQSKVIQARKLKIKISQVLNMKIKYNNHLLPKAKARSVSSLQTVKDLSKVYNKNIGKESRRRNALSAKKVELNTSRSSSLRSLRFQKKEEDEGIINLFENFTDEQLLRIEENENYYLTREEVIAIFRKYMVRKRLNNKDFSYENFTIKNNQGQYMKFTEDGSFDKKSFILTTLGVNETPVIYHNQSHILTNPIEYTRSSLQPLISRSLTSFRESKKPLFNLLKDKQLMNKDKIIQQHHKKILDMKIDRNYYDGLATEKRAVRQESFRKHLLEKNRLDCEKSRMCRERVKTVREEIGKSVELAETVRAQLLKRRSNMRRK